MLRFALISVICSGCFLFGSTSPAIGFDYITSILWSNFYDVDVVGDYAYCSCSRGLIVLDVTDPIAPECVSRIFCEGVGREITVAGNYAYLANYWAGLRIINISDPTHPFIASTVFTSSRVNGVIVDDGYAFVSDVGVGVTIILDLTDPVNPEEIASFQSRSYGYSMIKQGDYLYLGGILEGFDIVNVSDPANPIVIPFSNWYSSEQIFAVGNLLYHNGHTGGCRDDEDPYLRIFDITDPAAPVQISEFYDFLFSSSGPLVVIGDYAYVNETDNDQNLNLLLIDISDPANPVRSASVPLGYRAFNFSVRNNKLYVTGTDSTTSISVFDVSDPSAPVEIGSWWEATGPRGVAQKGTHLYVADSGYGFHVVDIIDPANPLVITSEPVDGNYREIHMDGDYIYLVDYLNSVNIFDISDPGQPEFVTMIDRRIYCMDICGDYLYFTHGSDGLSVYNNANPLAPVEISTLTDLGHCYSVDVESNYAYLAVSSDGIRVVDISNPEQMVPRGGIDFGSQFIKYLEAYGSHLFVPEYNGDLMIIDVKDPDEPELINAIELEYLASTVKRIGDIAQSCG